MHLTDTAEDFLFSMKTASSYWRMATQLDLQTLSAQEHTVSQLLGILIWRPIVDRGHCFLFVPYSKRNHL